ncbi:MAG: MarR family transcriptional regulator [Clostridiales bacterium]|nr:MarR family transcriptional regulator [Clostridiales bacterium]
MIDLETIDPMYMVFGNIFTTANQLQVILDQEMEEITAKQFYALIMLDIFEDAPTLKELAEQSGTSHQNMKQIILKLQHKGYIEIRPDRKDKRAMRIYKTDLTEELSKKYDANSKIFMKELFSCLSKDETAKLSEYLIRISQQMRKMKEANNGKED